MTNIAIVSDIHGNLAAWEAVLQSIRSKGINKIFCLGDICEKGNHMIECLQSVKENCEVVLKGNGDINFRPEVWTEPVHGISLEILHLRANWLKEVLTDEWKEYILNLPFSYEFYMSGRLVRLFHAHPEKLDKGTIPLDSWEKKRELFLPSKNTMSQEIADIVICGHVHQPFADKGLNRRLFNPGTVGYSCECIHDSDIPEDDLETPMAQYGILTGDFGSQEKAEICFTTVDVPYDNEKELEDVYEKNPEPELHINAIRHGIYPNVQKVLKQMTAK